jgi:hypothetical protein
VALNESANGDDYDVGCALMALIPLIAAHKRN